MTVDLTAYDGLLVDAFGVLYNQAGGFEESAACVQAFLAAGKPVVVVTNNTSVSPETISSRLNAMGMPIAPSHILSSGRGLAWDPEYQQAIDGRSVFLIGADDAAVYVADAGARCVNSLADADAVVLACTAQEVTAYDAIIEYKNQRPNSPVFCINPDRYIPVGDQRVPVIGYFAERIEQSAGPVHWMGKPLPVFSAVVRTYCQAALALSIGENWVFVDDNPNNVRQITQDLGVQGLVSVETGLAQSWPSPLPESDAWRYIKRLSIRADLWYDNASRAKKG